jgi:phenylacetate-CoA ligase
MTTDRHEHTPAPDVESLDRETFEAMQWQRLRNLVDALYIHNPFYRDRLRAAGVTPEGIRSRADLARIPTITKEDLLADQEDSPPYGRRLGVPERDVQRITMSGGTSGIGREIQPLTKSDLETVARQSARALRWAGLKERDILAFNVGVSNHNGGWAFLLGAEVSGRAPYLIGHESFAKRLELMSIFGADGLWGTPSALNGLCVAARELGTTPRELVPNLRFVLMGAEAYPVEFAERMREEWDAPVYEVYGSTATLGISGSTCEAGAVVDGKRGGIHLYEDEILFEIVDPDTDRPVEPGESGELIITTLAVQGSPLLRMRTRDRVTYTGDGPCACRRPFALIEAGTIGRSDDMLKIKNVNIWPNQVDDIVFAFPDVAEYRGEVLIGDKGRDEARLLVAFRDEASGADEEGQEVQLRSIQAALREHLELTFDVQAVSRDALPTFDSGERKARRWSDRRMSGLT